MLLGIIIPRLRARTNALGRDYRTIDARWMELLDHCRYIPTMRWFGKQLVAVCEKS